MGQDFSSYNPSVVNNKGALTKTWQAANHEAFIGALYDYIFKQYPGIAKYFPFTAADKTQMAAQKKKFTESMDRIMHSLDKPEELKQLLIANGKFHSKFKIGAEDYDNMRKAVLHILKESLKEKFTDEDSATWDNALKLAFVYIQAISAADRAGTS